jgi:hypothetical protein
LNHQKINQTFKVYLLMIEVVAREDHEHIPANVVAATTRGER